MNDPMVACRLDEVRKMVEGSDDIDSGVFSWYIWDENVYGDI